jgi:uncharacterized protein (AIM24 family)
VEITLDNETVRAEAGALCYMMGNITLESKLIPSFSGVLGALLSEESLYRPIYTGTGVIYLESSLGGYHMFELKGETWILDKGAYWASEGSVKLGVYRESLVTSFWAGEGFIDFRTKVSGTGKVVLIAQGPVEEISLEKGRLVAEGRYVIARTEGVSYKIRRPTKSYLGRFTAGESFVRVYQGTGRLLLCSVPFWRYRVYAERGSDRKHHAHMT